MKRLVLIILFVFTTSACNKNKNTLYIVFHYTPLTKIPNKKSEIVTVSTLMNFYDPLVKFDADFRPYPSLSEYWDNPDSDTWVFYLRKNVKFHDGKTLTSKDVLYTFNKVINDTTSDFRSDLSSIDTIIINNSHTVTFKLKSPCPTFLERISQILIIEKDCPDSALYTYSCGTGMLNFIKEGPDGTIYAEVNKEYFGKKVKFNKVIFTTNTAITSLYPKNQDNAYFLFTVKPNSGFHKKFNFIKIPGPVNSIRYIGVNTKRWPLNKSIFRRAIYLSLCREKLKDTISKLYNYPVLPAYEMALYSQIGFLSYKTRDCVSKDSVQKLLKMSGYNGEPISFIASNGRLPYAKFIQNNLKEVGINIKLVPIPPHELFKRVKESEDFSLFLLALIPQSIDIYSTTEGYFHSRDKRKSLGAKNYFFYNNYVLDSLIEVAGHITKKRKREEILRIIEHILVQDLPAIPLLYEGDNYYISKGLNYKPRLDRLILTNEIKLYNEY